MIEAPEANPAGSAGAPAMTLRAFEGVLLGTAIADAIGLPYENLSAQRGRKIFGVPPLRHRFLFGRGMGSDDSEHACMTAQALLDADDDPARFARSLAWRLRWWLAAFPAGLGRATLRATLRLWLGFSPQRSGVYSKGNGPAMRSAVIGLWAAGDDAKLRELTRASTRLTHTSSEAEEGALAIALAAAYGASRGPDAVNVAEFLASLNEHVRGEELLSALSIVGRVLAEGGGGKEAAAAMGLSHGISGYINHTVPVALACWLRWPGDYRRAVEEAVTLGGDADTTAAVTGALVGATAGPDVIPQQWINGLADWPRSVAWMRRLAGQMAQRHQGDRRAGPVALFWPAIPLRNLIFLAAVLVHGFRRLLPPY